MAQLWGEVLMQFDNEDNNKRRELITEMLRRGVCDVTFTKVNGEVRRMPCTLREDLVPAVDNKESKKESKKKSSPDNMSVWCTDKQEWRSFKLANVTEVIPSE